MCPKYRTENKCVAYASVLTHDIADREKVKMYENKEKRQRSEGKHYETNKPQLKFSGPHH
jgi:hypothetical protein